jgi:hypothetical protein
MREPSVKKEYIENVVEEVGETYRYWDYAFDFGDRRYSTRVYTDEPEVAYVDRSPLDRPLKRWWKGASRDPHLRAIHRHLRADTGRRIEVHVQTPSWWWGAAYKRVDFD